MSEFVIRYFIRPMRAKFDDPFTENDRSIAFFQDLILELSEFSEDALKNAVPLLDTGDFTRRFPTIKACKKACASASKSVAEHKKFITVEAESPPWRAWKAFYEKNGQLNKAKLMKRSMRWTVPTQWPSGKEGKKNER